MGFEHDIFIGFAPSSGNEITSAWTVKFCNYLTLLMNRMSERKLTFITHEDLRVRQSVLGENPGSVFAETAVFVLILSPEYIKSKSYIKELEDLYNKVNAENTENGNQHRIFKVLTQPIPAEEQPECLRDELSYNFFEINRYNKKAISYDITSQEPAEKFWSKLVDLAYDITDKLDELSGNPSGKLPKDLPAVFLAETSFDQTENRDKLKRELQYLGYRIIPVLPIPEEAEKGKQSIDKCLSEAVATVHLLGAWYGDFIKNSKLSFIDFQVKTVKDFISAKENTRKPYQIIWIPNDIKPTDQRQALYLKRLKRDEAQYQTEIIETSFEVFKTILNTRLSELTNPQVKPVAEKNKLYVIYEKPAQAKMKQFNDMMRSRGFEILEHSQNGEENPLSRHINNLLVADAVLIYKGESTMDWLNSKIRDLVKAPGYGKSKPFRAVEIISMKKTADKSLLFLKNVPVNWDEEINAEVINHFFRSFGKKMTENPIRNIKTNTLTLANPFPGLRPFSVEESHLFFGREGQCETVLGYLAKNRFAAVTGASGSGKSSLIYCGLIPALYGGFITEAGSKWRIITTRPGNSPVENLAEAIAESDRKDKENEELIIDKQIIYTILRRSSFGLVNAVRQIKLAPAENILLILDQFEELFRFKESRKDITVVNETEAYIKMLVNAIRQKNQPIYVVLTMRSDFIGECSQFQELTKLINKSNFLIPQMTRDDFKEAITGPLAVGGAEIDPQLLQHLLNAIEDKNDQLPVLQHVMMRTWEFWTRNNEPNAPLKIRDYEVAGRIENALSMHANEAFDELTEEGKGICKVMFRCLTEKGTDNKGTRHPATVKYIGEIAQVPDQKVIDVVNKFRAKGRSFLTPGEEVLIDSDTVIDISHESLMRIWDKLKSWVDEEYSSVQMYLRLAEASSQYQVGKTGLWRPPDLQLAINWKKTQKPTLAWAKKYNPAFEKVMVFLDASEKKYQQEEQNKVRLQRMELNRTRKFAVSSLLAAVAFLFISVWGFQQRAEAIKRARESEMARQEAEYRKKEADSLRDVANSRASIAEMEEMMAQLSADSADKKRAIAYLQTKISDQQRLLAQEQAEEEARKSAAYQQEKIQAETTAKLAVEQQTITEKEKVAELRKKTLSIAQTMAVKTIQTDDKNLRGLLAYQAYIFNRDYDGQSDHPDIYMALYNALCGFWGDNYNLLPGHTGPVKSVAFVPGTTTLYSSGADGKILKWDLNGNVKAFKTIVSNPINRCMAISPNGRWLANATLTSAIQFFNLNTPASEPELKQAHKSWVSVLAFTPDSKGLYSASNDRTIIFWDLISGSNQVFLNLPNTTVRCMAVAPAGRFLYGGTDDGRLIRWNLDTKEEVVLFKSDNDAISALALNSNGTRIAFVDKNGTMGIVDTRTNLVTRTVQAHSVRVMDIKFSPDDRQIATASMDKKVKIWDAGNLNNRPITITKHNNWVLSVAFSPDGKYVVSADNDGNIYYWPSHASAMSEQMCGLITRNMNQREWETYVGYDINYVKTCPNK